MLPLMSKITPMETGTSSLEKSHDFLFDAVLEDAEILLFEPGHQPAHRIGHRHAHQRQFRFRAERIALLNFGGVGWRRQLQGPAGLPGPGVLGEKQKSERTKDRTNAPPDPCSDRLRGAVFHGTPGYALDRGFLPPGRSKSRTRSIQNSQVRFPQGRAIRARATCYLPASTERQRTDGQCPTAELPEAQFWP